jgi:hypothetical protein
MAILLIGLLLKIAMTATIVVAACRRCKRY